MFVAYEAIAILPETLDAIKAKLNEEELDKYEETLKSRVNSADLFYIIFNIVENLLDSKFAHTIAHKDLVLEFYDVAKYNETIIWITKKN